MLAALLLRSRGALHETGAVDGVHLLLLLGGYFVSNHTINISNRV